MKAIKDFFDLTIGPEYVPSWSNWEAIREFIQNALDGIDDGFPMMIHRGSNGTIVIRNQGAVLKPEHLILGRTSKAGGNYRGQYGEGFKLGMMALCRQAKENKYEHALFIHTGNETWEPCIYFSKKYDTNIIRVNVYERVDDGYLSVEIPNIDLTQWLHFQNKVLYFGLQQKHESSHGDMLLESKYKENLFCKGLWVSDLPYVSSFGYNLKNLTLDRDRKMAEVYEVRHQISSLLADLTVKGSLLPEQIIEFLDNYDSMEYHALIHSQNYSSTFKQFKEKIATYWQEKYGETTVPVVSDDESSLCASVGVKYKTVSFGIQKFLAGTKVPQFLDINRTAATTVSKIFKLEELTHGEINLIEKAKKIVEPLVTCERIAPYTLNIVTFAVGNTQGCCNAYDRTINISRNRLTNLHVFLDVLIHEIAHLPGYVDLSKSHIDEATSLSAILLAYYS